MDLTELQVQLRAIEKQISHLHMEIEDMKPKTEENKLVDFAAIDRLALKYPIQGLDISKASESVAKKFITSLCYLILTAEGDLYVRLLYLRRLSAGCGLGLSAEELHRTGLRFQFNDLKKVYVELQEYKYSYLIEAFIIANLAGEAPENILRMIADIASIMGCDKAEIRVLGLVAKAKLTNNFDVLKSMPLPSINRWMEKLNDYIPQNWIKKQRVLCESICLKYGTSILGYDSQACTVKKRIQAGTVVKKGDPLIVYEKNSIPTEFKTINGTSIKTRTAHVPLYAITGKPGITASRPEKEEKTVNAPCDGVVFFIKKNVGNTNAESYREYLDVYVVSYFDNYNEFCEWHKKQ